MLGLWMEITYGCGGKLQIKLSNHRQMTKSDPEALGFGMGLANSHHKKITLLTEILQEPTIWMHYLHKRSDRI
jgi:hypothetical protein